MTVNRTVITVLAAGGLVVGTAGIANATGSESGYRSCAGVGNQEVVSRGYTTGTTKHTQNGASVTFAGGTSLQVTNANFGLRTANWTVSTPGTLNASGTYSYCPS